jgi:hypothetical protein
MGRRPAPARGHEGNDRRALTAQESGMHADRGPGAASAARLGHTHASHLDAPTSWDLAGSGDAVLVSVLYRFVGIFMF